MLELLQSRGMQILNQEQAVEALQRINYYRLSAYWYPDLSPGQDRSRFRDGTNFAAALERYEFDCSLRTIVWSRIEIVEIAFRRAVAAHLSKEHGPFPHVSPTISSAREVWAKSFAMMQKEYERSEEEFANHHKRRYPELVLPPIWAVVELISFGVLVKIFKNLESKQLRQQISRDFAIDESVLTSWFEQFLQVRNACAHHSRLWNRRFSRAIKIPTNLPQRHRRMFNTDPGAERRMYNSLVCLDFLETQLTGSSECLSEVLHLMEQQPTVSPTDLGFPGDYQARIDTFQATGLNTSGAGRA